MADYLANVTSPYISADQNLSAPHTNHYQIADDHALLSLSDVTGLDAAEITPDPNLGVVEVVCDAATLDAIEADATYQVLASEELPAITQ